MVERHGHAMLLIVATLSEADAGIPLYLAVLINGQDTKLVATGLDLNRYAGSRSITRMIAATVPLLVAASCVSFPQLYTSPALHVNFMSP